MTNYNITPFDSNPDHHRSSSEDNRPKTIDEFLMADSQAQDLSQYAAPRGNNSLHRAVTAIGGIALLSGALYFSAQPDRRTTQAGITVEEFDSSWRGNIRIRVTPVAETPNRTATICELNAYTNAYRLTRRETGSQSVTASANINPAQFAADTIVCQAGQRLLDAKPYLNSK